MFSPSSCCLEWSSSDPAGKAVLCLCKWQQEEHRGDGETLKVRSLLSIVTGSWAKADRQNWMASGIVAGPQLMFVLFVFLVGGEERKGLCLSCYEEDMTNQSAA